MVDKHDPIDAKGEQSSGEKTTVRQEQTNRQVHDSMPDLVKQRKELIGFLKDGGKSGITNDFGKQSFFDSNAESKRSSRQISDTHETASSAAASRSPEGAPVRLSDLRSSGIRERNSKDQHETIGNVTLKSEQSNEESARPQANTDKKITGQEQQDNSAQRLERTGPKEYLLNRETFQGLQQIVHQRRQLMEHLKSGGKSGITEGFGKTELYDSKGDSKTENRSGKPSKVADSPSNIDSTQAKNNHKIQAQDHNNPGIKGEKVGSPEELPKKYDALAAKQKLDELRAISKLEEDWAKWVNSPLYQADKFVAGVRNAAHPFGEDFQEAGMEALIKFAATKSPKEAGIEFFTALMPKLVDDVPGMPKEIKQAVHIMAAVNDLKDMNEATEKISKILSKTQLKNFTESLDKVIKHSHYLGRPLLDVLNGFKKITEHAEVIQHKEHGVNSTNDKEFASARMDSHATHFTPEAFSSDSGKPENGMLKVNSGGLVTDINYPDGNHKHFEYSADGSVSGVMHASGEHWTKDKDSDGWTISKPGSDGMPSVWHTDMNVNVDKNGVLSWESKQGSTQTRVRTVNERGEFHEETRLEASIEQNEEIDSEDVAAEKWLEEHRLPVTDDGSGNKKYKIPVFVVTNRPDAPDENGLADPNKKTANQVRRYKVDAIITVSKDWPGPNAHVIGEPQLDLSRKFEFTGDKGEKGDKEGKEGTKEEKAQLAIEKAQRAEKEFADAVNSARGADGGKLQSRVTIHAHGVAQDSKSAVGDGVKTSIAAGGPVVLADWATGTGNSGDMIFSGKGVLDNPNEDLQDKLATASVGGVFGYDVGSAQAGEVQMRSSLDTLISTVKAENTTLSGFSEGGRFMVYYQKDRSDRKLDAVSRVVLSHPEVTVDFFKEWGPQLCKQTKQMFVLGNEMDVAVGFAGPFSRMKPNEQAAALAHVALAKDLSPLHANDQLRSVGSMHPEDWNITEEMSKVLIPINDSVLNKQNYKGGFHFFDPRLAGRLARSGRLPPGFNVSKQKNSNHYDLDKG